MIHCNKENGSYTLTGLMINDLDVLQEGLHRLFNESQKTEHRDFRSQILRIDRAIDPELERHFILKEFDLK
jgi:hypothetical protein